MGGEWASIHANLIWSQFWTIALTTLVAKSRSTNRIPVPAKGMTNTNLGSICWKSMRYSSSQQPNDTRDTTHERTKTLQKNISMVKPIMIIAMSIFITGRATLCWRWTTSKKLWLSSWTSQLLEYGSHLHPLNFVRFPLLFSPHPTKATHKRGRIKIVPLFY